ncbi:MAG: type II secretion system protein GspL [Xanthomonadales bacterium]|nr:type II secretion system protein GspL [Xanthomonadales bacterium]
MTDTLIVQLVPPFSGVEDDEHGIDCTARWLLRPGEAQSDAPDSETGLLSHLLEQPPVDCRWIVLLPGEDVLTTAVSLPKKRRRQALGALPFMLEDSVASDVAREHLAVGADNGQGETPVAITRKQHLRDLLNLFEDAGITLSKVLPDYASLAENPDTWQALVCGDRVMVRRPDNTGFSAPLDRFAFFLNAEPDPETDTIRSLCWIRTADTDVPELPGNWQISEQVVDDPIQHLMGSASTASLNLLQGEFKVAQKEDWNWRPWAMAAVLAVVAVFIGLLETGLDTARLNRENERLQAMMFDLAREALPGTQQIRDPQAQLLIAWRQLNKGGPGGADFLTLLNRVSATINQQAVTVNGIHFRDGALTVALRGSSLQQLDNLRQKVERQGLYAELLNADTDADSARSNLVIRTVNPDGSGSTG